MTGRLADRPRFASRLGRSFGSMVIVQRLRQWLFFIAVVAAAAVWLVGCAAPGGPPPAPLEAEIPEVPPGEGRIVFYRTAVPFLVAVKPEIIVNGQKVGTAAFERYSYRNARPGRYEVFLTSDKDNPVYFTLAAGETRYVKAVFSIGITGTKLTPKLIEAAEGRADLESLQERLTESPAD